MKIKFTTKITVPPTKVPVEVQIDFDMETDVFEEEEQEGKPTFSAEGGFESDPSVNYPEDEEQEGSEEIEGRRKIGFKIRPKEKIK